MKELTIEEKAKCYDEAIERAKKIHKYSSDLAEIKRIEQIFPELKESENIRIIKAIKYGLDHVFTNNTTVFEVTKEQCLAWLEKQGEKSILFTFDDVLALQCCMETVKKVQEDKELYNELLLLHNKVYDAYTITKR